jgi:predicted branched-subunit amino acid permease
MTGALATAVTALPIGIAFGAVLERAGLRSGDRRGDRS